jgi:hypothetical protein
MPSSATQRFIKESVLSAPARAVYDWHARPGAFERLAPPWQALRTVERSGGIANGGRVVFDSRFGPITRRWEAVHRDAVPGERFTDEQLRGPFASWVHTHRFVVEGEHASRLVDEIEYRLPLGAPGAALGGAFAEREIARLFRFRHRRTRDDLARHAAYAGHPRLMVAMSGASGLVGRALAPFLTTGGHAVRPLVRRAAAPGSGEIAWDPARGELDAAALEGCDAVVHLAGENIGAARWTPARKEAIRESRVASTRLLCEALARMARPPRVLVAASAVGWYGASDDERGLDEEAPPGHGFLAELTGAWEAALEPARAAGIRVVALRIGVVIAAQGGALAKMLPAFKAGLGGPIGGGKQWVSWIALDDLVGVAHAALFEESWSGPVNAVSPQAVRQAELARTLGRVLRRPALLPLPAFAVRSLFGEMGQELLLDGARIVPGRLAAAGFPFLHASLEQALRVELGRNT